MTQRFPALALASALVLAAPAALDAQSAWDVSAPAPAGFDRAAAQQQMMAYLGALVRLDTRNPPGHEMQVARWLDSTLRRLPGVETHVLDEGNGRANFIARLRATHATRRPVLVMGHMDVVTVDSSKWQSNALVPTVRDGELYGRGVIDDKGPLAATVVAFERLAAQRDRLTRDVILVGTADEEGGTGIGIDRIVGAHFDYVKDAEFAMNEGGRIRVRDGAVHTVNIQTTEKVPYNVVATAHGPSGHASVPLADNVLAALARSVAKVHAWQSPVRLNETTRLYFERLATVEADPVMRDAMRAVSRPGATPAGIDAAAAILSREPLHNAVLRTGQSLTLMSGGIRNNVIPSEATANFNVRVLPDEDIRDVVATMNRVSAEPQVTYAIAEEPEPAPPVSPVNTALFQAMEAAARAMAPKAVVVPFMSTGATDGALLRAKGIPTYGILPFPLPMEDELRMHGDNERVPVPALGWGAEYMYRVLLAVTR